MFVLNTVGTAYKLFGVSCSSKISSQFARHEKQTYCILRIKLAVKKADTATEKLQKPTNRTFPRNRIQGSKLNVKKVKNLERSNVPTWCCC